MTVVAGIAAAAAKVTTPRIPVHDTTTFSCQLNGRRSIRDRHLPGGFVRRRVPSAPRPPRDGTGTLNRLSTCDDNLFRPNIANTDNGRITRTISSTIADATATCVSDSCVSRRSSSTNRRCNPM